MNKMPGFLNPEISWGRVNPWFLALAFAVLMVANVWPRSELTDYVRDEKTQIPKYEYRHQFGWPVAFIDAKQPQAVPDVFALSTSGVVPSGLIFDLLAGLIVAVAGAKFAEALLIWLPQAVISNISQREVGNAMSKAELAKRHVVERNLISLLGVVLGAILGFLAGLLFYRSATELFRFSPEDYWPVILFNLVCGAALIGGPILGAIIGRRIFVRSTSC